MPVFNLLQLVRPNILTLNPYSSARSEYKGSASVLMDANESPFFSEFNRYPDPMQKELKNLLGDQKKVNSENIFLGNGSDEAIDLLLRVFCEPGTDEIIGLSPGYGMYKVAAEIQNIRYKEVALSDGFNLDPKAVLKAVTPSTKLIFLCSPNNPTGNCLKKEAILELIEGFAGLVILDEAYIDFSEDQGWLVNLKTYPQLVILQTFSKARGLAGLRVGMAFAEPKIISLLNKVKAPYNLNSYSQKKAIESMTRNLSYQNKLKIILSERERLAKILETLPMVEKVFPSEANFLLVRFDNAKKWYKKFVDNGLIVRDRSSQLNCDNCLRISIGCPEENDRLLSLLGVKNVEIETVADKKKVLFIDRDGTLIIEPPVDYQVDSLAKLTFYPEVFRWLRKITDSFDYELVMVTNQDGMGSDSFPESTFWPAHKKMLEAFENEGIVFDDIIIDTTFEHENAPTRKPGIALLSKYVGGEYDLDNSFVIGDRPSDVQLAINLNAKGIYMGDQELTREQEVNCGLKTQSWEAIFELLESRTRSAFVQRITNETSVSIDLKLNGKGHCNCNTGIAFFDHMLDQLARHGRLDIAIDVQGDLDVDEHHTIEDTAIALGETFSKAIGNKLGMERYGYSLPMDDCLAQVAIDFGGRNWLIWDADFNREKIGDMPTEMFFHFFKSFSDAAKCNLNIKAEGSNEHHKIEAIFKAFAKAVKMAVKREVDAQWLPSTKGIL